MIPLALSVRLLQAQPDGRLLALAQDGHELAFEVLVRRYRRPLLAYSRRITPDGAEDVLQQALLQAWGALGAGAEVTEARAWLYRIVHNAAITAVRNAPQPPDTLVDVVAPSGLEHLVEQRLAARDALAHLAALPELQRLVMLGSALEGRSHEELAAELGLSGGSVRGLIYRARATLRAAAAALIPSPLADWAVRCTVSAPDGSGYQALAGGGSVGVAGLVIKGGTAATVAGALAGAAAIVTTHSAHRHGLPRRSPAVAAVRPAGTARPQSSSRIVLASTDGGGARAESRPLSSKPGDRSTAASGRATVERGTRAPATTRGHAGVRRLSATPTQPVDRTRSGATGAPQHTTQLSGSSGPAGSGATTASVAPPGAASPAETTDTAGTSSAGSSTDGAGTSQPSSTDGQSTSTSTTSTSTTSTPTTSTSTTSTSDG